MAHADADPNLPLDRDQAAFPNARELEVLRALAAGLTTDETAERLGLPTAETEVHLKRVLRKLGARSRLDAILRLAQDGLIELPISLTDDV